MLRYYILFYCLIICAYGYFTLPGNCPENIKLQENIRLDEFLGEWYQSYHYASNGKSKNNCSVLTLKFEKDGNLYLNQSRVDLGLFHRYSIARILPPNDIELTADFNVTFVYPDAPNRLMYRNYPFRVLATDYNYYATVYTCSYSSLIDKHYIYVWLLSRSPILNEVSKALAIEPLHQLGITEEQMIHDKFDKCHPKYYDDFKTEPTTFRKAVPI